MATGDTHRSQPSERLRRLLLEPSLESWSQIANLNRDELPADLSGCVARLATWPRDIARVAPQRWWTAWKGGRLHELFELTNPPGESYYLLRRHKQRDERWYNVHFASLNLEAIQREVDQLLSFADGWTIEDFDRWPINEVEVIWAGQAVIRHSCRPPLRFTAGNRSLTLWEDEVEQSGVYDELKVIDSVRSTERLHVAFCEEDEELPGFIGLGALSKRFRDLLSTRPELQPPNLAEFWPHGLMGKKKETGLGEWRDGIRPHLV